MFEVLGESSYVFSQPSEREREREGNIRFTIYYDLYPSLDDV